MDSNGTPAVNRFCYQYLQLEPNPDFPGAELLQLSEVQDAIYARLFADGALQFRPPVRYQLHILKQLVVRIENSIEDWEAYAVSDDLASALSLLLATPLPAELEFVQQKCYVTYHLTHLTDLCRACDASKEPCITMLENRFILAATGTTGLRTWEAALHMGQFLCQHPELVAAKHVLELGSGTGYLSILCAKYLGSTHVVASDGSDDVINNLPDNFFLNALQDSHNISATDLKWGHALVGQEEEKWNGGRPVDVVLGADITYDHGTNLALIGTLLELFELYPAVDVYLSATQRNRETFEAFLDNCRVKGLVLDNVGFPVLPRALQTGPFYNDQTSIQTYRISR